jgi:8-oxo-dGTP pyrophosphatase MutT (NUDIX family)
MHPRPAATVILLRDPYEVLMVRRNPALDFMGGFWVFPGGKVEPSDGSPEQAARRELTEEAAVRLPHDAELIPFARWITPAGLPKRYDTWFFLAQAHGAGGADDPQVDGSEIVEARWISPQAALEDTGELAFPTRRTLEALARHPTTAALIAASRNLTIEPVRPEIVHDDGSAAVVIPGAPDQPPRVKAAEPPAGGRSQSVS